MLIILIIILIIWTCHDSLDKNKDKETRKQARTYLSKSLVLLLRLFK